MARFGDNFSVVIHEYLHHYWIFEIFLENLIFEDQQILTTTHKLVQISLTNPEYESIYSDWKIQFVEFSGSLLAIIEKQMLDVVAFSGGSRISPRRGHQHTILPNFPQNCMKLKEFGPPGRGGGARVENFTM